MRSITCCPACQTQFFVTEIQLNKHDGKVRCGQCLHVFNAKTQFVAIDTPITETTSAETPSIDTPPTVAPIELPSETLAIITTSTETAPLDTDLTADTEPDLSQNTEPESTEPETPSASKPNNQTTAEWPAIDHGVLDENELLTAASLNLTSFNRAPLEQEPFAEEVELSASPEDVLSFAAESTKAIDSNSTNRDDEIDTIIVDDDTEHQFDAEQIKNLNDITKLTVIADNQANYFDDLAGKHKLASKNAIKKSHRWLWFTGAFILLVIAAAQSIYFLRDDIAIYYPNVKPILVKACQQLACSVNLPKQIELIVIDDSDMQEDKNIEGVMHLSSSLINKAGFNLAYPNLELTLTDVEDNPTLRRVLTPIEYLSANTNVALGLKAGEEIKIKLAITTQGETVAGYRIFVTY